MKRRNKKSRISIERVDIIKVCFLCVSSIFIVKLFIIQVVNHDKYKALAKEQHWELQEIPARRGDILSSDGFVLAGTQTHYLLFAEPKKIEDVEGTAAALAKLLTKGKIAAVSGEREDIYQEYNERIYNLLHLDLYWVILERGLPPVVKDTIEKEELLGVGFEEEPVRHYPEGVLASHVLGFVACNEDGTVQGYFGIEGELDGDLRGKAGRVVQEKDALGAPILLGGHKVLEPINGSDVVLTLDRSVQYLVEKRLKEGVEDYGAISGSVIVMDPLTSEVIAMANYPTYTPGNFGEPLMEDDDHRKEVERKNLAISEIYEPGSVMKPLTISAAVDMGKVAPTTTFVDDGPVQYSDYVIDNWDGQHHGVQTIVQLLQKSNNIGAAWVGHQVGAKKLAGYLDKFGLGERTGIELEGEDTGIIRDYKTWTAIDLATVSFGQGISATPLQVLNAFNVFANGGDLYRPKIISQIVEEDETIDIPSKKIRRVISKETADTMVDMLTQAVEGGESKFFNIKSHKVAGKTGTAQIPHEGKYDPNKTNTTFVGFLPVSKKFSMIVRLNQPSISVYAAETAVPLWMHITDDLIKYYGIYPDNL